MAGGREFQTHNLCVPPPSRHAPGCPCNAQADLMNLKNTFLCRFFSTGGRDAGGTAAAAGEEPADGPWTHATYLYYR